MLVHYCARCLCAVFHRISGLLTSNSRWATSAPVCSQIMGASAISVPIGIGANPYVELTFRNGLACESMGERRAGRDGASATFIYAKRVYLCGRFF